MVTFTPLLAVANAALSPGSFSSAFKRPGLTDEAGVVLSYYLVNKRLTRPERLREIEDPDNRRPVRPGEVIAIAGIVAVGFDGSGFLPWVKHGNCWSRDLITGCRNQ